MKAQVQWDVKEGVVPKFVKGDIVDVTQVELDQANRDSPGCLVVVEEDRPGLPSNDRMLRDIPQTRAPQGEAMHSGNTAFVRGYQPPAEPQVEVTVEVEVEVEEVVEFDATDAAVALADDHGLDLATVRGTGKDGRITVGDVRAALE